MLQWFLVKIALAVIGPRQLFCLNVLRIRNRQSKLPLFEIARVLMRLDHVASLIVNANHSGVSPHRTHYSGVG